ncbi:MAG: endonuclease/exonuclease/phosphatase family protein [Candidatus Thiodiazotropha sp.]
MKNSQSSDGQILPPDIHGEPIKVATYNVHRSIGPDGIRDLERTAQVIKETGARVIALQEVEERLEDSHTLADSTGMTAISGMTLDTPDRRYGNILLTNFEIRSADVIDISWERREPRSIIDAMLETPGGQTLRCLATHLGLSSRERNHQHRLIATLLSKQWEGPTLLMGDLNEWRPFSPQLRRIDRLLGRSRGQRSFPSRLPLLPLDRIWISPNHMLRDIVSHRTQISRMASDHLPVVAQLDLE